MRPNVEPPLHAELMDYVHTSMSEEETFHYFGFEFLHRLNIVRIQNELLAMREHIAQNRGQDFDEEKLSKLLNDYSENSDPLRLARTSCF